MSDTESSTSKASRSLSSDRHSFPWTILLACFVILLPVLAFPFGQDHSTFIRGGREILAGGTLYVDFIDVKPPLIYIVFGIIDFFSAGSVVLVRFWEVMYQLVTLAVLLRLMQRVTQRPLWLWGTAITYSVIFAVLGYSQIGQPETFCALPIVVALSCAQRKSGRTRWLALGIAIAFAFLLKYTLAIIGPAVFYIWMSRDGFRNSWRASTAAMLTFVGCASLAMLPFLVQDGFIEGYRTTFEYLKIYSSDPPLGLLFIVGTAKSLGFFFGYNVSITVAFATFIGIAALMLRRFTNQESSLILSSFVMLLALGITIVIERKYSPYHFGRLYIPIAVLTGVAVSLLPTILERFRGLRREARWTFITAATLTLLALSPLPRYGNVVQLALRSFAGPTAYDKYLTRPELPGFDFTAVRALKNDLDVRLKPTDSLFMMSMMATPILTHMPTPNTSAFVDSHLYFGFGSQPAWRQLAATQVRSADWVVVDTIDVCELVNMHLRTSWQSLQQDSLIMPIVRDHFAAVDTVACFIIYKRVHE